jgi:peroxiredoxin
MNIRWVILTLSLALASAGASLYFAAGRAKVDDLGLDWSQPKHPVTPDMWEDSKKSQGLLAPRFVRKDLKGAEVEIGGAGSPQFLYFIKNDCPCSVDAQPLYARLERRFGKKARFVAVTDGYPQEAEKWARQMDVQFPMVSDPSTAIMQAYAVPRSVYAVLIGKDGRIVKLWPGYGEGMLKEVNRLLAKELGEKEEPFDPQYAPKEPLSGCKFEPRP